MLEHMVQKVEVCGRTADSPRVLTTSEYDWPANIGRIMFAQALRDNNYIHCLKENHGGLPKALQHY